MRVLAINVFVASAIFLGVTLVMRGGGFTEAAFSTVVFALVYAAFQVALVIFGKGPE